MVTTSEGISRERTCTASSHAEEINNPHEIGENES